MAKYWSFSFSISPSNEYSKLISLGLTGLISLQSKGLSRVFSNNTVQKHQFFGAEPSAWSNSLQPHGLQHPRLPCPSPTPRAYSNSCALSQWEVLIVDAGCFFFFEGINICHLFIWLKTYLGYVTCGHKLIKIPTIHQEKWAKDLTKHFPKKDNHPGAANGNPLQYSCLGNPMDRGSWETTVHGVTKSQTQLSD